MTEEVPAERPSQKSIEDHLSELVRAPDPDWVELRWKLSQALVASYRQNGAAVLAPLLLLLQSEKADTRFRAAYVLGHTLHYVRTVAASDIPETYRAWAAVVQRRYAEQSIPDAILQVLVDGLRSKSAAAQVWAAGGIVPLADSNKRAAPLVVDALLDRDPQVKGWCAVILPGHADSLSILVDVVCNPQLNRTLRDNALSALEPAAAASRKDRAATARSRLRDLVGGGMDAATYAAIALGILAPSEGRIALPVLLAALENNELGYIRQRVAESIVRIDPTLASEPAVARALEDDDPSEGYW